MTTLSYPVSRRAPVVAQVLAAILGGLLIFFGLVLFWVVGYQLVYAGRIFPGVSVAGVDLSGMSPDDAALRLSERLSFPISGKVMFRQGDKAWVVSPVQLGMVFDASASARTAADDIYLRSSRIRSSSEDWLSGCNAGRHSPADRLRRAPSRNRHRLVETAHPGLRARAHRVSHALRPLPRAERRRDARPEPAAPRCAALGRGVVQHRLGDGTRASDGGVCAQADALRSARDDHSAGRLRRGGIRRFTEPPGLPRQGTGLAQGRSTGGRRVSQGGSARGGQAVSRGGRFVAAPRHRHIADAFREARRTGATRTTRTVF